ncbi:MAG: hypothetical protein OXE81_02340 [Gammaproteobacteria bacterium]|nr:hypothetical protein [Gammaproteobacteria bacterium]
MRRMRTETSLLRDSRARSRAKISDADLIQPRKVALGGTAQANPARNLRQLWIFSAILIAALLLLALIALLPERREPVIAPDISTPTEATAPPPQPASPTPLERERQKRALEDANTVVRRFTELEIELEDTWNAATWGEADLGAARRSAADAETAFANTEYDRALLGYQQGVAMLEAILKRAQNDYAEAIDKAGKALSQRDADAAETALDHAARYQPKSAIVEASRRRLDRLPEVIALLDQATQAESRGEINAAIRVSEAARAIDANTEGINARLARLRQTQFDAGLSRILADGFEALDTGDFQAAEDAFTTALGMKPDDAGARQGLAQTRLTRTNLAIETALADARQHVAGEQWSAAINAFERVLEVDPNLTEAVAGLADARLRESLDAELIAITANPGALAGDQQYARALAALQSARNTEPKGARLNEQTETLAAQLQRTSTPAQLTLVSDAKTDVRLQYHGDLGRFTTRYIETRPGSYLIRGGRDGFHEVRFEVDLGPGAQRVEVVCSEPIN